MENKKEQKLKDQKRHLAAGEVVFSVETAAKLEELLPSSPYGTEALFCHTELSMLLQKSCVFSINLKPGKQKYERKAQWESDSKKNTVKKKSKD